MWQKIITKIIFIGIASAIAVILSEIVLNFLGFDVVFTTKDILIVFMTSMVTVILQKISPVI